MNACEITLNVAVNLGRLARWAHEGKINRLDQFLQETQEYVGLLESAPKSERFMPTFIFFQSEFNRLKIDSVRDERWAEEMLTWANILTHRAKLAN